MIDGSGGGEGVHIADSRRYRNQLDRLNPWGWTGTAYIITVADSGRCHTGCRAPNFGRKTFAVNFMCMLFHHSGIAKQEKRTHRPPVEVF